MKLFDGRLLFIHMDETTLRILRFFKILISLNIILGLTLGYIGVVLAFGISLAWIAIGGVIRMHKDGVKINSRWPNTHNTNR